MIKPKSIQLIGILALSISFLFTAKANASESEIISIEINHIENRDTLYLKEQTTFVVTGKRDNGKMEIIPNDDLTWSVNDYSGIHLSSIGSISVNEFPKDKNKKTIKAVLKKNSKVKDTLDITIVDDPKEVRTLEDVFLNPNYAEINSNKGTVKFVFPWIYYLETNETRGKLSYQIYFKEDIERKEGDTIVYTKVLETRNTSALYTELEDNTKYIAHIDLIMKDTGEVIDSITKKIETPNRTPLQLNQVSYKDNQLVVVAENVNKVENKNYPVKFYYSFDNANYKREGQIENKTSGTVVKVKAIDNQNNFGEKTFVVGHKDVLVLHLLQVPEQSYQSNLYDAIDLRKLGISIKYKDGTEKLIANSLSAYTDTEEKDIQIDGPLIRFKKAIREGEKRKLYITYSEGLETATHIIFLEYRANITQRNKAYIQNINVPITISTGLKNDELFLDYKEPFDLSKLELNIKYSDSSIKKINAESEFISILPINNLIISGNKLSFKDTYKPTENYYIYVIYTDKNYSVSSLVKVKESPAKPKKIVSMSLDKRVYSIQKDKTLDINNLPVHVYYDNGTKDIATVKSLNIDVITKYSDRHIFNYKYGVANFTNKAKNGETIDLEFIYSKGNEEHIFITTFKLTESKEDASLSKDYKKFTDIKGNWAEKYIKYLGDDGITDNTSGKKFKPNKAITKQDLSIMIARYLEIPVKDTYPLLNINSVSVSPKYMNTLEDPTKKLTREELVVIIMNVYNYKSNTINNTSKAKPFDDHKKISKWAYNDILDAKALGIVKGVNSNSFYPQKTATRAYASYILYNLVTK